jgi:hypothetical protein
MDFGYNSLMSNQISIRSQEAEQKQIKRDVFTTLGWNAFFLIVLFVLYFVNKSSGLVDQFFAKVLNF